MPEEGASQRNLKLPSALGFSEDRKFRGVPGGMFTVTVKVAAEPQLGALVVPEQACTSYV